MIPFPELPLGGQRQDVAKKSYRAMSDPGLLTVYMWHSIALLAVMLV